MHPIKYFFMLPVYAWLRFDPILWLAFRHDWTPRYEFMAAIFGENDSEEFLAHRVNLVKARNKILPPIIQPRRVDQEAEKFLKSNPETKTGRAARKAILNQLIFWALDPDINQFNIDSYLSRAAIIDVLLNILFQNSLTSEIDLILTGLNEIVFSRVTYLGPKGEISPYVHDVILSSTARILTAHFNETIRLRDAKLDKMTKIKLIKEIQKSKGQTGSLAFSAESKTDPEYINKFPLPLPQAKLLWEIICHYQYSAWFESREKAQKLIAGFQTKLGFSPEELFASK